MMQRNYASTDVGQIHYIEAGSGDTVVLLHQIPMAASIYSNLISVLREKYHVIAPDMPGFGASDNLAPGFQVEDIGAALQQVIGQAAVTKAKLFGVHLGAAVAAELARSSPDLVESATLAGFPYLTPDERVERIEWIDQQLRGGPGFGGRFLIFVPQDDGSHFMKRWHTAYRMACWGKREGASQLSEEQIEFADRLVIDSVMSWRTTPEAIRAAAMYDSDTRLPLIRVPTLVMHVTGPHESEHNKRSEIVADLIPDSRVATFDADEPYFHYWQPQGVVSLLEEFWSESV